jgi:ferritin-like metal-binding protein YciE
MTTKTTTKAPPKPAATATAPKSATGAATGAATQPRTMRDLLEEQLHELYAQEVHSEKVLPKMAEAAEAKELAEAFRMHATETKQHVTRLERVFMELGMKPRKTETHGSKGLLEDCLETTKRSRMEPHVRDAALIAVMQRLEHDEMAGYGCARTWAALLGHPTAASELLKSLVEERRCDEGLTKLAERLNKEAMEAASAR